MLLACAVNRATGEYEFNLPSEREEQALGRQADRDILAKNPLLTENPGLTQLVHEVGLELAAQSERSGPWNVRVLDDHTLNAFAVPGGYLYVTRGLLAHLVSVDQLAVVLAHELAHVTARHGSQQLRRQAAAARRVGLVRMIDPNLRHLGAVAARSAGLSLLRHSRAHEEQADRIGLRYAHLAGYRVAAMPQVLDMLAVHDRRTRAHPRETWRSTHPDPTERRQQVEAWIASDYPKPAVSQRVGPDPLLDQLVGVAYGIDPRNGFARGATYHLPRLGVEMDVPAGWRAKGNLRGLLAAPASGEVLLAALLTGLEHAADGTAAFFDDARFSRGETLREPYDSFPSEGSNFAFGTREPIAGRVVFIETPAGVWMLLALADYAQWQAQSAAVVTSLTSFRRIRDPGVRAIEPPRLTLMQIHDSTSLREIPTLQAHQQDVAWLNQIELDTPLAPGTRLKVPTWPGPQLPPAR
ncbi:MAG: M48 family metalloprotease [Nannocystaceae bacterium]